ncbi:MAG: ATP-dependent DNA helicase RecG [Mollicutes bacterium]|nr:ATP-dependent DNA helicase RecG [Mollicutes bacterium]
MNELTKIKGIGPKTISLLEKLNIYTSDDLLNYYPFRFEILKKTPQDEFINESKIIIDGVVSSPVVLNHFRKINKMSFFIKTSYGLFNVVIFNRSFLKNNLTLDKEIIITGKLDLLKNTIVVNDLFFGKLNDKPIIKPIYHTTAGLKNKNLNNFIQLILRNKPLINEILPPSLITKYKFIPKISALNIIHNPETENELKKALLRLKYEELFIFMLKINVLKNNYKKIERPIRTINRDHINKLISSLSFELTVDQKKALEDIISDLSSDYKMNRLLQGDVGSGKTIVAALASYIIYENGYQTAFMVPTELLAIQHYQNLTTLFKDTKMRIKLLLGSTKKKDKELIYEQLKNHEIDLIIGTHALIQDKVEYSNLGLVITDEQHRFGVNQRNILKDKSQAPDVLYLSATPIPRTYALTIYGDMNISNIKTKPQNRKEIKTIVKTKSEIKDVLILIKEQLELKHQVFVVAPMIEEDDTNENVLKLKRQFDLAFSKICEVGLLHGKMKSNEKDSIMQDFSNNKIQILISTTVIEVGIDIKNATMMVIFDANKFGLSTLHQLRGRVGRNDLDCYCVLISDKKEPRLEIMTRTNDGFEISEEDFKMRGSGDIFGYKQSGEMAFKISDLKKDYKILMSAKEDSEEFLKNNGLEQDLELKNIIMKSLDLSS